MSDKLKKRVRKSVSLLQDCDWPLTDEETLAMMLDVAHQRFLSDPTNPLYAFNAILSTVSYVRKKGEPSTPGYAPIPFWALEVLADGFKLYIESTEEGSSKTFGEVLGIEGGGKGKPRKISKSIKELRDIRIAIAIALQDEVEEKVEAAIQDVAAKTGLNHQTVRDIWSERAEHARDRIKRLRIASQQR